MNAFVYPETTNESKEAEVRAFCCLAAEPPLVVALDTAATAAAVLVCKKRELKKYEDIFPIIFSWFPRFSVSMPRFVLFLKILNYIFVDNLLKCRRICIFFFLFFFFFILHIFFFFFGTADGRPDGRRPVWCVVWYFLLII
jgi:hypothetical protein